MDAKDSNDKTDTFAQPMDRRRLVKGVGFAAAAAGALTAGFPQPALAAVSDVDILAEGCPAGTPPASALRG
jgi:hypothetical protein